MPCIICKKEAPFTARVLLEDCSVKDRQYYEANYFTNWEFNYICSRCYWRDFFRRLHGNLAGFILTLAMQFTMVFTASLAAWSFIEKQGLSGPAARYGPAVFSAAATLVFFRYFVKMLLIFGMTLAATVVLIYGAAYSDTMSLLPDLGAVVQRERIKQGTLGRSAHAGQSDGKSASAANATTGTGTVPGKSAIKTGRKNRGKPAPDPVELAEQRRAGIRRARVAAAFALLDEYLPFKLKISLSDLEKNVAPSLRGFALLYLVLLPWHLLIVPLYRRFSRSAETGTAVKT